MDPATGDVVATWQIGYHVTAAATARLDIYNALGQNVRTLVRGPLEAGTYTVTWDGRDQAGREVTTGVYLRRMAAAGFAQTREMALVR